MKRLKKIDGSCAVVALHYVSGADEDSVIRICTMCGFEEGAGMEDPAWKSAAEHLGIKVRALSIEPCTLRKFVRNHEKGLYLMGTHDHLFVVDNGIIVDPRNSNPPGLKRIIKQAWRVVS